MAVHRTLVTTEKLARHPEWRVFDCRHDLAKPEWGEAEYARAHIPGARFANLDRDLSAPKTGKNGRHPLPDPETFARRLGDLAISNASQVVAYDASGSYYAARLWWMLR